ncbi:hypothetical protein BOSE62_120116 [Bosea sp. 62]|nr:hypothetical protein BOSE7B_110055 [Bosea sp. 7B]CAD5281822.1 hypothetical protein BOSE21B_30980 [Bosea sp. 21B]CAD5283474.1 hypothetical protein BOSE46_50063 [Bosea sp. 46]VVT52465.1 hypothetical protein BOS5A_110737 [Bosea sp. EC-HK365B]VXB23096.1 hypothetical protein BOSE62_120116 [Bosea sp. 62]VXB84285.1 hypothetical protein BOSE127_150118 [Bosea sp. 127]VXC46853.1 hypothetical protein BOSE29B_40062 [Bosea sp. 29B]VXC85155.1 hypothetical protein BOSE125_60063 [Bosea sp. 125]
MREVTKTCGCASAGKARPSQAEMAAKSVRSVEYRSTRQFPRICGESGRAFIQKRAGRAYPCNLVPEALPASPAKAAKSRRSAIGQSGIGPE